MWIRGLVLKTTKYDVRVPLDSVDFALTHSPCLTIHLIKDRTVARIAVV